MRKNAADYLDENPETRDEIEAEIRRQLMPHLNEAAIEDVVIPEAAQETLS